MMHISGTILNEPDKFIEAFSDMFKDRARSWVNLLYETYNSDDIEAMCAHMSGISFDDMNKIFRSSVRALVIDQIKAYIINDPETPLSESDKVYLMTYEI